MTAIFLAIAVAIFLVANVAAFRVLMRVHPRRRRIVIALIVIGNVMWIFFPILNARTDFSRFVRALFGPPWFAWTCFAILYSAFALLLAIAWQPFRRRMSFAKFARWPSRIFLWSTLFALVAGVWNALVPLRIERVPIVANGAPPFRIALISDLHTGLFSRTSRLEQIFVTAAAQKPDVILLAGDNVDDDPIFTAKLLAATRVLDPRMPLLAVLGNHEMYGQPFEVVDHLRGSRIRLLVNEALQSMAFGSPGSPTSQRALRSSRRMSTPHFADATEHSRSFSRISRKRSPRGSSASCRSRCADIRTVASARFVRCSGRSRGCSCRITWGCTVTAHRSSTSTPEQATGSFRGASGLGSRRRSR